MSVTTTNHRKSGVKPRGKSKQPAGKRASKKSTSLAAANKWLAQNHESVIKLAERNTVRLIGKPRA